ncbi:MAG TPA: hypothetical protein VFN13_09920 [Rudaea sp.]|nr:hypothetical protein [Rudaea sp.]
MNVIIEIDDAQVRAAIMRTRDGRELYLTSFRRSNFEDVARIRRRDNVLRDEIG